MIVNSFDIFILASITIIAALFVYRCCKNKTKPAKQTPKSVQKKDLEDMSDTEYLLEAGKNRWRLHDDYYGNPDSLLLYAIGFLCNNSLEKYTPSEMKSLEVAMRLNFLLWKYTDEADTLDVRVHSLVQRFVQEIQYISPELQKAYKLSSTEKMAMIKIEEKVSRLL